MSAFISTPTRRLLRFAPAARAAGVAAGLVGALGGIPGARLRTVDDQPRVAIVPPEVEGRVGQVLVTVHDGAGGPPLLGAHVRALAMIDERAYLADTRDTDRLGRAPLARIPRGETWIVVDALGRARSATRLVMGEQGQTLSIDLTPEHVIDVVVRDEEKAPVASAEIEVAADSAPVPVGARTGPDGRCHVGRLGPGPWRVTARAVGYEDAVARVFQDGDAATLILRRLGFFEVRVVGEDGGVVSGARVAVAGATLWPPRTADTDGGGDVRIGGLAAGVYAFRATRGDRTSPIDLGVALGRGEGKAIVLRLAPGRWVAVRVVDGDADDAETIAGARVTLAEGGISPFPIEATTDGRGRARLGPIAAGMATLSARADGFVSRGAVSLSESNATRSAGSRSEPREVRIALARAGVLSGRVVDDRGYPVDGATIEIVGTGPSGSPIVDDPRRASFQAAQFDALLGGPTPLVAAGELGVMPGPVPPIPLLSGFDGRVAGGTAMGLTGAPRQRPAEPWVTRADGTFRAAPASPGRVRAIVHHPQYVDAESEMVTLAPGAEAHVEVVMRQGGALDGRVVDALDRPVAGARVLASGVRVPLERAARTSADGTFAFAALPGEVSVTARSDDDDQPDARVALRIPQGGREEVTIRLPPARGPLEVSVVDDRDWPVHAAQVSASSLSADVPLRTTAFTDARGEAKLKRARGVPLRVEASAPGLAPRVVTTDGSAEMLRVQLTRAESAAGAVVTAAGADPVPGADVTLYTDLGVRRTRTDSRGGYSLSELAPGEAMLRVRAPGFAAIARSVVIADSGGRRPFGMPRTDLAPEGVVQGEVLDARGGAVAGARVARDHVATWLVAGGGDDAVAVTDARGRFSLGELAEGSAVLEAYAPELGRGRLDGVRIVAGRTTPGARIVLSRAAADDERSDAPAAAGGVAITLGETDAPVQVVVVAVAPGSEAERAGVAPGDVLLGVDDVPVVTMMDARAKLGGAIADDVVLRLRRGDRDVVLRVAREAVRR